MSVVERKGRVAIVGCAAHSDGFGALAATLDALRDGDTRAVVLDTDGLSGDGRVVEGAAMLGAAVLPVVAAWTGEPGATAIAAGLFADIRTGDALLRLNLGVLEAAGNAVRERLTLVGGTADVMWARMTAEEALQTGLISELADDAGGALAAAVRIAEAIAERGPIATQLAKEAVWRGVAMPLEQALRFETDLTLLLQATKDREEGVRAFLERRPPEFEGV